MSPRMPRFHRARWTKDVWVTCDCVNQDRGAISTHQHPSLEAERQICMRGRRPGWLRTRAQGRILGRATCCRVVRVPCRMPHARILLRAPHSTQPALSPSAGPRSCLLGCFNNLLLTLAKPPSPRADAECGCRRGAVAGQALRLPGQLGVDKQSGLWRGKGKSAGSPGGKRDLEVPETAEDSGSRVRSAESENFRVLNQGGFNTGG